MANYFAIHSVGQSIVTFLKNTFPADPSLNLTCDFTLASSSEINGPVESAARVTLYLYRVTQNQHLRNARHSVPGGSNTPLAVDLHYLLTVWADNPQTEHTVLAWVMRQLHFHPVLDKSSLTPEGNWDDGDVIQIIPSELTNEDVMRIWDALEPKYRLSVTYTARVVRIDGDADPQAGPVVASRFQFGKLEAVESQWRQGGPGSP